MRHGDKLEVQGGIRAALEGRGEHRGESGEVDVNSTQRQGQLRATQLLCQQRGLREEFWVLLALRNRSSSRQYCPDHFPCFSIRK